MKTITISLRTFQFMLAAMAFSIIAMVFITNRYLHTVDMPQPRCTLSVEPTPLENAPKVANSEVWL